MIGLLAAGRTREEILGACPYLESGDIDEALAYAARRVKEREVELVVDPQSAGGSPPGLLPSADITQRARYAEADQGQR